jgi:D-alanyl-D-alanine carboxypeptidase/D-alanyl-D-alanine-endopeptidase (penicillin-binding protein 4)
VLAAAAVQWAPAQVPPPVSERLDAAALPADALGFAVLRMRDGATVLAHNAERPMQPASTLKLLTSWVALEELGPGWKGRSELRTAGEIAGGVLRGDLVLAGMADVDLDWRELERMLRRLRVRGIREIRGDLVLDRSYFSPARTDVGLAPFDEAPEFRYNVVPDALLLNTNLVELDIASDGRGVRAAMSPALDQVRVVSDMTLVDRRCADWEDGWRFPTIAEHVRGTLTIRLQGEFPRDCTASTAISVIDRDAFALRLFRLLWRSLGGTFRGGVREASVPGATQVLAHHSSRPLVELLHDINKDSDNPVTRVVYLALGATSPDGTAPTAVRAEARMRAFLAARGVADASLVLENGSGLSRAERIRPRQLAAALRAARGGPWSAELVASMPIAALDGGMRSRLNDSPAAMRARIKTGTLRDASAVAGYVRGEDGEEYVVVAMINHPLAAGAAARPALDALVDWVARGRAGTRP